MLQYCIYCRMGPIPLSAFGEEGDEDVEDVAEEIPRHVPWGSTLKANNMRPPSPPAPQDSPGETLSE